MASNYYPRRLGRSGARSAGEAARGASCTATGTPVADVAAGRPNIAWLMRDQSVEAPARRRRVPHRAPGRTKPFTCRSGSASSRCARSISTRTGSRTAWTRFHARWPDLSRSMLLRIQLPRIEAPLAAGPPAPIAAARDKSLPEGTALRKAGPARCHESEEGADGVGRCRSPTWWWRAADCQDGDEQAGGKHPCAARLDWCGECGAGRACRRGPASSRCPPWRG